LVRLPSREVAERIVNPRVTPTPTLAIVAKDRHGCRQKQKKPARLRG
jgi:hypothetical protein